jgi:(p)ppGpp synthase/HD superfamily hydrolase
MAKKLSEKFSRALTYMAELHRNQKRKGTRIPYVGHLLEVAGIVIEYGGNEDQAIAALLHDAVEDQGGPKTRKEIRKKFGEKMATIVDWCSDTDKKPKPPWRERKETYLRQIARAPESAILVTAADKLQNIRAITRDYRTIGNRLWKRFSGGKSGTLWYHRALVEEYKKTGADARIIAELDRAVSELEKLVGRWTG